ncbi:NAD(P)H-binding protein [Chondromyces crocatus]|uniref:NmrA family transcriptional regulator n=1 Tax=Chondromyces crocatus TaxID=52 RepID=A0A0K1ELT0_CHOCO|nr:NAD(P)H-binding protein [Chondromyces crocatus]AKT41612.1 NmrA family transcriptional regulator [Chondromyces crocatus]
MIIVTGATGKLGRQIVEKLIERVPPSHVGASVRDPAQASDLLARGVRVRRGDFAEPSSLAHAFEGVTQLLLVSSNARAQGGDTLAQHRAAIEAARTAGARRILYTSHMGVSATSEFPPMHDHAATEALLAESGLAWTSLRNGFYAASGLALLSDAFTKASFEAPRDGKVSWTAHADLAEAAAIVLTEEGRHDGPTPPLTAAQALDLADLADIASSLLGRPVQRDVIEDDTLRATLAARSAPANLADIALGLYRASRRGEFATVDPTLERWLGRPPMTMRDVLTQELAARKA